MQSTLIIIANRAAQIDKARGFSSFHDVY